MGKRAGIFDRSTQVAGGYPLGMIEVFQGPPLTTVDEVSRKLRPALVRANAERAYVFGSYAAGRADRYSDLDLLIVIPTDCGFFERGRLLPEAWSLGVAVDVLIYTPAEWEQLRTTSNPLAAVVVEEGRLIYERPSG
jgi:predicted nucleotidyltransferase